MIFVRQTRLLDVSGFLRGNLKQMTIERYKVTPIIKGFTQNMGLTSLTPILMLLRFQLYVHCLLYMDQPSGFVVPGQKNKVCGLKKSLYDLKQELKQWYDKFHKIILSFRFKVNGSDACV